MSKTSKDKQPLVFGKYRGKTPEEVYQTDPGYIVWMHENVTPSPVSKDLYQSAQYLLMDEASDVWTAFE